MISYFSMEIGLDNRFKNFAGGLGILAGDTLKSAADLGIDMVGITLNYSHGYFQQELDPVNGFQIEHPDNWDISKYLILEDKQFELELATGNIKVRIWRYEIKGFKSIVPVYFLDTDFEANTPENRSICYNLYTSDSELRLKQEILLGMGGVKALETLGLNNITKYHLNESHAAFAILKLREDLKNPDIVKSKICFTTHTPVMHGHKVYPLDTLQKVLKSDDYNQISPADLDQGLFNMSKFCLNNASFSNAVSKKHAIISRTMFPGYEIDFITNGVHSSSWSSQATKELFDKYLPGWQEDPMLLRNAEGIGDADIWETHHANKIGLIELVKEKTGTALDKDIFTIGFGRRVDQYKRQDLILHDIKRLQALAEKFDGLQVVFGGKAYPGSQAPDGSIATIYKLSKTDLGKLKIAYIPNYDMEVSLTMVSGSDLWLNNPLKPLEASGTSGMKAALNGVPNLSMVDGWWVEGVVEDVTGWAIGDQSLDQTSDENDANLMYDALENKVLPTYYLDSKKWIEIQKQAISLNASHFNTERMLLEYVAKGYIK